MTRTVIVLTVLAGLAIGAPAFGQFTGPGAATPVDVKAILANPVDDTWVTLRGQIIKKIGRDKYLFSDGTGQIRLDIDDKYFPAGVPISSTTKLQISGEVDADYFKTPEIDVKNIVVLSDTGGAASTPTQSQPK
ncbi:MAG: NirD/YgiW/YdeI family stress tolerance protein [Pseudomonadota bacterium]